MKRIRLVTICCFCVIVSGAEKVHSSNVSLCIDFGGSNTIGDYEEYLEFGISYGANTYYSLNSHLMIGAKFGINRWTPQEFPYGVGVLLDWTGSAKMYEIIPVIRLVSGDHLIRSVNAFMQMGTGVFILDSNARVLSKPLRQDGQTTALHIIDSQIQPGLNIGCGVLGSISDRIDVEFSFQYNYVFTDNETEFGLILNLPEEMSTEYYNFNMGLLYRL